MTFFSVVIPLYNKKDLIAQTLESALAQTFTDFEIIVIDDGSTDNSGEAVSRFTDKRIRYIKTPNQKVSAARNKGIAMATGEVIAFLDADDLWEPEHLQVLFDLFKENPTAGMLASRYTIRIGNSNTIKPVFINIDENYTGLVEDWFGSSLTNRISVTSAVAVPKHVFEVTGVFNPKVTHPEDTEMWIKIALKYPVAISNHYTMTYNFDQPESWSRMRMASRKLMNFNQFKEAEKENKSVKAFIDIHRARYALKFRIEGDIKNSDILYNEASPENIHWKTRLLFAVPPVLLRQLLQVKHWLHKKGLTFSIYN